MRDELGEAFDVAAHLLEEFGISLCNVESKESADELTTAVLHKYIDPRACKLYSRYSQFYVCDVFVNVCKHLGSESTRARAIKQTIYYVLEELI